MARRIHQRDIRVRTLASFITISTIPGVSLDVEMTQLSLWAPNAKHVELVDASGNRFEMQNVGATWEIHTNAGVVTSGYKFSIDGHEPIPDPRSRYQPNGVHGYSVIPTSDFNWNDSSWNGIDLASSVLYELHVGTFSTEGTFLGIIQHLDYLVALGVNIVELMPVAEFAGSRGWGYDGVDLWAPHHTYGSPDDLRTLIDECHKRGLGVFLDVVYNHLGPEGNYLQSAGPYFTPHHKTPWGNAVNFDDEQNEGVRAFVIDNAAMWLTEFHFDGLRIDATHAIVDKSPSHIVRDIVTKAEQISAERGWPAWITVESASNDPVTVEESATTHAGWGTHAQWNDDFHHCIHVALTGESGDYYSDYNGFDDLVRVLHENFALVDKWSPHRQQTVGRSASHIAHDKFIGFIQNHDHVGNRAQGERLGHLVAPDQLYIAATFNVLGPFIPLLFQGEEWAASTPFLFFTDYGDPELAQAVREGRRNEFKTLGDSTEVPDPQDETTFRASKLIWNERASSQHARILDWYTKIIALRHQVEDFRTGPTKAEYHDNTLLMWRGSHLIVANIGSNASERALNINNIVLHHGLVETQGDAIHLGPYSVAVAATNNS